MKSEPDEEVDKSLMTANDDIHIKEEPFEEIGVCNYKEMTSSSEMILITERDIENDDDDICIKKEILPASGTLSWEIQSDDLQNQKESKHRNEQMFSCDQCEYSSARSNDLKRHKLAQHSKERPFKCDECEYSYAHPSNLKYHKLAQHSSERPFKCNECDYTCIQSSHLKYHKLSHHSNERPFNCDECEYSCVQSCHLKYHKLSQHSNERSFKCDECDYSCIQSINLKYHKLSRHSNERPFNCDECDYSCVQASTLKSHKLTRHSNEWPIRCNENVRSTAVDAGGGYLYFPAMDVEQLISEVFRHRAIWCWNEPKHNDRIYINKAWDSIAAKLNVNAEAAKRKFKILRDQFRAELKKVPSGKSGDPHLPMEEYLSNWQYFQMLFFLRDVMTKRKPFRNSSSTASRNGVPVNSFKNAQFCNTKELSEDDFLSLMSEENIEVSNTSSPLDISVSPPTEQCSYPFSQDNAQSSASCSGTPNSSGKERSRSRSPTASLPKKAKIKLPQEELMEMDKEKMPWNKRIPDIDDDAEKYFLLSLLPQLKSLPPKKLSNVKIKISQLVHEALYEDTN